MTETAPSRLPVSVLTGFLGSGKTTLLKALLTHPQMARTAVVINEFGEIGLDHELVAESSEDMVLLNSGCICCTVRGDLVETLRNLYLRRVRGEIPEFDRVMVETTGLADPAPILHTLMNDPILLARYRLDGVIATVDAVNGSAQLDEHFESLKQAAVADRIVLTKTDLPDAAAVAALKARLHALNPAAPVMTAVMGDIAPDTLLDAGLYNPATKSLDVQRWLHDEAYDDDPQHVHDEHCGHDHHDRDHAHGHDGHEHDHAHGHHHDPNRHDDRIRAFCLYHDTPIAWSAFSMWLEMMATFRGADLLRLKGIVNIADVDKPVVVHGVQHVFHPPVVLESWPSPDRRTRIVLITRDMDRDTVEHMFRNFTDAAGTAEAAAGAAGGPGDAAAGPGGAVGTG